MTKRGRRCPGTIIDPLPARLRFAASLSPFPDRVSQLTPRWIRPLISSIRGPACSGLVSDNTDDTAQYGVIPNPS